MTLNEGKEAIKVFFLATWGGISNLRTPIAWDDAAYDAASTNDDWVRFAIRMSGGDIASLGDFGNRRHRYFGVVLIQVFTLVDKGEAANDGHAKVAIDAFRNADIGIRFSEIGPIYVGPEGKWYQQNVSATFEFDEVA